MKQRLSTKVLLVALGLLVMGVAGCESAYTGPLTVPHDEYQPYPNVTVSQGTLAAAIRMREPVVERLPSGLLAVTLPLRSASDETLHVEWRVDFLTERGVPIEPRMQWRPLRMDPRQPASISANSTSPTAEDYNIQLRWGLP